MLKLSNISILLGYSVSVITFVFGMVIISGIVFKYVPFQMRLMFGIVMILWGIYRFIFARTRARQKSENGDE